MERRTKGQTVAFIIIDVEHFPGFEMEMKIYLKSKVHANGGSVMFRKELVDISLDDARLPTPELSDNQHLEYVLSSVCHVCTHAFRSPVLSLMTRL